MSDVRKPGNPGGTRGKACPQHNSSPLGPASSQDGTKSSGGTVAQGKTPGKTSGRKGNPVR